MGSRVELFAAIRRFERVEGLSIRELARRHGVHRRTVRAALTDAEPPPRKTTTRAAPQLDPYKAAVEEMLTADLSAPRKQRHTARRVHARLVEEHGAVGLSYSTVRDWVRVRRAVIDVEAGRRIEVFVPQEHAPGAEAEVDFGEVWVVLAGVKTKCHMFVFRMSHSGKAIHRIYPTQGQDAFLEGHLAAFDAIGGVPTGHIRYDNLTCAVSQVLHQGKDGHGDGRGDGSGGVRGRKENDRWLLFRSHCGFDAFYCQPGIVGAHEKGGVEGEVGRFRRNRLTPMPVVDSLDELNARIISWEAADDTRRITGRLRTVGEDFATEQPLLAPLPQERFDPGLVLHPRVDRSGLITVRMARYSVPAHLISRRVRVSLRASELVVFDGRTAVARHERVTIRGGASVVLDHYLEVFTTKPGACPAPPPCPQHAGRGRSRPPTTRSGPRPGVSTVMPPAPASSSTSCSCTAA
jgi:transposase